MDYANGGPMQGQTSAKYASLGSEAAPRPSRTFDRLNYAVERVAASRAQVEQMLARIAPNPPSDKLSAGSQILGSLPYAISLESLFGELDRLGCALDELASHI